MSNINANNITSQNITVTNLNVTSINGVRYTPNPCTKGYYVPCPDCDYTGPDSCDCGNTCDWCDQEPYVPDECDCYVPPICPPNNSLGGGELSYYYDLESGGCLTTDGVGPGFIIQSITLDNIQQTVAYVYPSVNYFNSKPGGYSPWSYINQIPNTYNTCATNIFYTMPYNGTITGVSVNTLKWFNNIGSLDLVIANGSGFTSTYINLPNFTTSVFPVSGFTNSILNNTFVAGDGIACVIKQVSGDPFSPISGLINISVFVKFTS